MALECNQSKSSPDYYPLASVNPPAQSKSSCQIPEIDSGTSVLTTRLSHCEDMPAVGKCLKVFQDVEAFAAEKWEQSAQNSWQQLLDTNPMWRAAEQKYILATQTNNAFLQVESFRDMSEAAYQSTSIRDNNRLYLEMARSLGTPDSPSAFPYQTLTIAGERIEKEQHVAIQWVENTLAAVVKSTQINTNQDVSFSSAEISALSDEVAKLGLNTQARSYYERAAYMANTQVEYLWHQLHAFETYSADEQKTHRSELDQIRSGIPALLERSVRELDTVENGLRFDSDEYELNRPAGTPQQIRILYARAWTDAYKLAQVDDGDHEHDTVAHLEDEYFLAMQQLRDRQVLSEADRDRHPNMPIFLWGMRFEVPDRLSKDELRIHLANVQRIEDRWTARGGYLESRIADQSVAKIQSEMASRLWRFLDISNDLVKPYRVATSVEDDPITNAYASILWTAYYDGNMAIDHPEDAIQRLSFMILPEHGHREPVADRMQLLRKDAPWLFDGNGQLNPATDVSHLPEGEKAALRTASRYMSGSENRHMGLTLGGSVAGGMAGAAVSGSVAGSAALSLLCGPEAPLCAGFLLAGSAGLGAGVGVKVDQSLSEYEHETEIAQSQRTGLALISETEKDKREADFQKQIATTMTVGSLGGTMGRPFLEAGLSLAGGLKVAAVAILARPVATETAALPTIDWLGQLATAGRNTFRQFITKIKEPGPAMRFGAGLTAVGADMFIDEDYNLHPDWKLNTIIGWTGLSLLFNETVGAQVLGVDPKGQVAALFMNGISEYSLQSIQNRPLNRPDGARFFTFNFLSSLTTGLAMKPVLLGSRHFMKFAMGNDLWMPITQQLERSPVMADILRPVVEREGTVKAWISSDIHLNPAEYRELQGRLSPQEFMGVYQAPGVWEAPSPANKFRFVQGRPLTADEFANLNTGVVTNKWEQTDAGEWVLSRESASPKHLLKMLGQNEQWEWIPASGNKVGHFMLKDEVALSDVPELNGLAVGEWKVQPDGRYVWTKPSLDHAQYVAVEERLNTPLASGKKVGGWSPKLTGKGLVVNALPTLAGVWGINTLLGNKVQGADEYYLSAHRVFDYAIAGFVTWPLIQVPAGVDTATAQLKGRGFGLFIRAGLVYFFPTYSEPWIGQTKYFNELNNHNDSHAFELAAEDMHSFTTPLSPLLDWTLGNNGPVQGTVWRIEYRAIQTFRKKHDDLIMRVAAHNELGSGVVDDNERVLVQFAKMTENEMTHLELGQIKDLEERRFATVLAVYIKSKVAMSQNRANPQFNGLPRVLQPFTEIMRNHSGLFSTLPSLSDDDRVWEKFIKEVNVGHYDR